MRSRLLLLDFILANQDLKYFETEQDKVSFFCAELGVPKDSLPAIQEDLPEFAAQGIRPVAISVDSPDRL